VWRTNKKADKACFPKRKRINPDKRNPAHLEWIRTLPCTIRLCTQPSVAAHVRVRSGGGMGLKPPDSFTVPLCDGHHKEQHRIGHAAFDALYAVDLRTEALRLAALSPFKKSDPDAF
jgi:hypothetical protein